MVNLFNGRSDLNKTAIRIQLLTLSGAVVASFPAQFGGTITVNTALDYFDFSIQYLGFDGRIPQNQAGYTSGLVAGDYLFRASANSYIQYDDSLIHVYNDTSQVRAEVRLIRMGQFVVTVHFLDFNSTLKETPVPSPGGSVTVEAYDERGNVGGRGSALFLLARPTRWLTLPALLVPIICSQPSRRAQVEEVVEPVSIIKRRMCRQVLVFQVVVIIVQAMSILASRCCEADK